MYNNLHGTMHPSFQIGKKGCIIYQGNSSPDSETGNDGDLYIEHGATPRLYQKINSVWIKLGDPYKTVTLVSSNYTVTTADEILLVDTSSIAITVTIPSVLLTSGRVLTFKDIGNAYTNNITVVTEGTEKIDGQDSIVIDFNYGSYSVVSDGTNWYVI